MQRLLVIALASLVSLFAAGSVAAFEVDVRSAIVMNMSTGQVLFEQNPDELIAPASLNKIMTMYLVYEQIEAGALRPQDKVAISDFAEHAGGSRMGAKAGQEITVAALLEGMAVASANDACVAIAERLPGGPGSYETFIKRMNEKAETLGMSRTTFINPNGMPAKGQFTTASDMLRLAVDYLQRFPHSLELHSKEVTTHDDWIRHNRNRLLGKCEGVDGLKTGYVRASGYNIISTAQRKGERIVAVILGAATSPVRKAETRKILEAAFAGQFAPKDVATKESDPKVVWQVVTPDAADKTKTAAADQAAPLAASPEAGLLSGPAFTLRATHPQPPVQDLAPRPTPSITSSTISSPANGQQQKAAAPLPGPAADASETVAHIPTSRLIVKHTKYSRDSF